MPANVIAHLGALLLAYGACASCAKPAETFGVSDLESQRITGPESVTVKGAFGHSSVSVLVTVGLDGRVIDAQVDENVVKPDDGKPAMAAARQWVFRPQTFDGHPVQAVGPVTIQYIPPEIPPDPKSPFPDSSSNDVEIVLERGACFGSCPDYRVSIRGDGRVRFSTREANFPGTATEVHRMFNGQNVLWPGTHEAQVRPEAVAALVAKFRAAHFIGLKPEYVAGVTDNPTYALTLRIGKTSKRVTDYVGAWVGMPAVVSELEDEVDKVAGTERWVRGNAQTVALLAAQGFDFRSSAAAELVQQALSVARLSDSPRITEFVEAAMARGLDLDAAVSMAAPRQAKPAEPIGAIVAAEAARSGNETLFDRMAAAGYLARMTKPALDAAITSEMGCSPKIAKALVAAGADPKAQGSDGNALHALQESYGPCAEAAPERRLEMARTLIALGVPLEARNSLGWTALMGCDDPDVARLLLAAGARLDAKDEDGRTPLLTAGDDRVALVLLRAGADPRAKDEDGSLRDQARKYHWPATLAWLDAHGIG